MLLLDYMNTHRNWEKILTQSPYNLKVKREDGYIIIQYGIGTDFNEEITHSARGSVFKEISLNKYICVCHPFDKFFNYGESYAAKIDWSSAIVREKVDGSLIKIWNDEDKWHISTNGCVNAFNAEVSDTGLSFGQLFYKAIKNNKNFFDGLDKNCIYMFELVAPENRLVVSYDETAIYYLGERDRNTDIETYNYTKHMQNCGVKAPHVYSNDSLEDVINMVNSFGDDEEGCVVCDKYYNRIKVKGQAYLAAFMYRCQMEVSQKRIVAAMLNKTIDDWAAYNPAIQDKYNDILGKIQAIARNYEASYNKIKDIYFMTRKDMVIYVKENYPKEANYIFKKTDIPNLTGVDYILSLTQPSILKLLKESDDYV